MGRLGYGTVVLLALVGGSLSVLALLYTFTIGHNKLWVGALGLIGVLVFGYLFRTADAHLGGPGQVQKGPRLGTPRPRR